MKFLTAVLLCTAILSTASQAQEIYKCVDHGAITYQQGPCEMHAATKGVSSNTVLVGTWSYDHDGTMAWMKHHDKMTSLQEGLLNGISGRLTFTFTPTLMSIDRKAFDIVVDGIVQQHMDAKEGTTPYNLLSANAQTVSISAQDVDSYDSNTFDFHFEGKDTMWLSMANQRLTAVDNPNGRVYYKRVQ